MTVGPVEYLIMRFPGNRFSGEIAPEVAKLVATGTIRILDLIFISKAADGSVTTFEFDEREELAAFAGIEGEVGGLISAEDIEHAASLVEPNSSEALLIWEDTWATPLVEALRRADGVLLEGARIPHELVQTALDEMAAAG